MSDFLGPDPELPPEQYLEPFRKRGFVLLSKLGSGASGTVFRATQTSLNRDVAVKIFDNPTTSVDPKNRKRFEREALLLARVSHPGVPVVLTYGELALGPVGLPFIVMEFIEGCTLEELIAEKRRVDLGFAARSVGQLLSALAAVHRKKIVHRDVKPSNVIIQPDGSCRLIDFSIGISLEVAPGLTRVTREGGQPGTFAYMAPEQKVGRDVDQRADLFSVGMVFFELLTGYPPKLETLDEQLESVPPTVRAVIRQACQNDPAARYENAEAFIQALRRFDGNANAHGTPAVALCMSPKCPDAQWTPNGYYEGPRIVSDTTDAFCSSCGAELSFPCTRCGRPYSQTQFCGGCGTKLFEVPECKQCGSWLKVEDMGADTTTDGCTKCRRKKRVSTPTYGDDDIPF